MRYLCGPSCAEPLVEGKGVTARWGLKEARGKTRTRRTETGYKADVVG